MAKFRVGISPNMRDSQGKPVFDPAALQVLDDPAVAWEYLPSFEAEFSAATAATYDALCVMQSRVTRATFSGGKSRLKVVARFGVGYDTIDVPACTENGAILTIAPDGIRRPMGTAVLTMVLALAQKLVIKDRMTREGRWAEKQDHMGMGLTGRTIGLVGFGNIGQEVALLAAPFEAKLVAHDPFPDRAAAARLGVRLVELDALLREADFVCVLCPLSERTRGLIGPRELDLMRPTAYLVSMARGPIVQEQALYEALAARRIAGAGMDVFEQEPTPPDNPILKLANVIVAPHALCHTDECMTRLARSAFGAAVAVARGKVPPYVVNPEALKHPALKGLAQAKAL